MKHMLILMSLAVMYMAPMSGHSAVSPAPSVMILAQQETGAMIQGNRRIEGTVRKIAGGQIEVDTGEVEPRHLLLKEAEEKGFGSVKPGDRIEIVLNDQNLVVDFHPVNEQQGHVRLRGQISQPLVIGHDTAVIRTEGGAEKTFGIKPLARSKMASIPIGSPVVFLIDESNQIVDVSFEDKAGLPTDDDPKLKSPLKGAQQRVEGTLIAPLRSNTIRIRTPDGREHPYEIRPNVQDKLSDLKEGRMVILLLDNDNMVVDVALPPG
jgi:hypothetical protein